MNKEPNRCNDELGDSRIAEFAPKGRFDLSERLLDYSVRILKLVDALPASLSGRHIASQLLRAGTAAMPHHGEAQAAESGRDFIHKMKLALKELREAERWLALIMRAELIEPSSKMQPLMEETDELIRIFFSSIRTALANTQLKVES